MAKRRDTGAEAPPDDQHGPKKGEPIQYSKGGPVLGFVMLGLIVLAIAAAMLMD